MYALQSAGYIPVSDWFESFLRSIRRKHKLDGRRLGILTKVMTITDIDRIFFDGCSSSRSRDMYFVAPNNSSRCGYSILTPQCDGEKGAHEESCVAPTRKRATPYQNVQNVLQQRTDRPRTVRRLGCQPQFLQKSENADEEHHMTFSEDRRSGSVPSEEPPLVCPNTLDEMLQIVSNVRQSRMGISRDHQVQAARTYVVAEQSDESGGSMFPSIPASTLSMIPRQHRTQITLVSF